MERCDILIAGGGPAGSSCAWKLRRAGVDVVVMDKATFPRDKVCAGWITPQVVEDLEIDIDDYRRSRTFQPITGFRVGLIGANDAIEVTYDSPVSFGIRRCEFDHYLLERSKARLVLGQSASTIRRDGTAWIVNDTIRTKMLVGAGGHFCPVARLMKDGTQSASVIAAQEVEFAIDPDDRDAFAIEEEVPELYFCQDLKGYGWCFRKQGFMNVGFGRLDAHGLPKQTSEFVDFLKQTRRLPADGEWRWRGHAYLLAGGTGRTPIDDGVMLIGDAAGLAYPQSGEGIRPAIESGLIAASTIVRAAGTYTRNRLEPYAAALGERFGSSQVSRLLSDMIPHRVSMAIARKLLNSPWFVRHLVIDRWFLHAQQPALVQQA
ncbi:MAG TPA: NAD(P)/FAD-dependent oxidoreductase [Vicinamibacterales bacterium]|nr:NAD(P)/FAD-dependent oxidoreductase [Vicinamibacterales bacterium]